MGSELVTDSFPQPQKTLEEIFWECYPAYLNMGMSYDEYWNGDAQSCVAYRKAYQERIKFEDAMLWRQGLYVYHAICCAAPALNSLKPRKPLDYIKPFGFEEKKEEDPQAKAIEYMKTWANSVNAMRAKNGK